MDNDVYEWFNRLADRTTWLHGTAIWYADGGIVVLALLVVAACLDARRRSDPVQLAGSIWAGVAALLALGIAQPIAAVIDRARPYDTLAGVHVLIDRTTDSTFPSDHATVASAVAIGLLLAHRRWGIAAAVAAVVLASTRIYVGVHYPSDVLAGLCLGAAVAAIGHRLLVPWFATVLDRVARTGAGRLVSVTTPTTARSSSSPISSEAEQA